MKLVSFFSGAGGLDLGFHKAGFEVVWANEYDKSIWKTYEENHESTILDKRSITKIEAEEVPDCDGIIGGPPCQSWSEAGKLKGIEDSRGQLFMDFIRILEAKKPKFFLAENVSGMLLPRHRDALEGIKGLFKSSGYQLSFQLLNAKDFGVPQDRKRVFFIGFRNDLKAKFKFPSVDIFPEPVLLEDTLRELEGHELPALEKNYTNGEACKIPNHEYMTGAFSSIYMSRNRVRAWDEVSYTIQAGGRHAPIHPSAPKMISIGKDKKAFEPGMEHLYRRLTVRECAKIQTFPGDFVFHYERIADGYKMVGNAVPVELARVLAEKIKKQIHVAESNLVKAKNEMVASGS